MRFREDVDKAMLLTGTFFLLCVFYLIYSHGPKFQIGDCVKKGDAETWESDQIWMVKEIGKKKYLAIQRVRVLNSDIYKINYRTFAIDELESDYVKTLCPKDIKPQEIDTD